MHTLARSLNTRSPFTLSGAMPYFALLWTRILPIDFCNSFLTHGHTRNERSSSPAAQ